MRRVYALVQEFYSDGYLTARFGCFCDNPEPPVERELEKRLGKPHLWNAKPETVNEEDLYQFIEVFHDLASRPIRGEHHSVGFGEYEWHPTQHSQQSGQELYRWRMNQLLDATPLMLRLADNGKDIGRMVEAPSPQLGHLVTDVLNGKSPDHGTIAHAITNFRSRHATVESKQSAVRDLALVLEPHRKTVMEQHLTKKDEGAIFNIANQFHIRHKDADQYADYRAEFLEWIFYWYLGTIKLCEELIGSNPP